MGYMICIFSIIYFIAYFAISGKYLFPAKSAENKTLIQRIKKSDFLKSGLWFVFGSLMAAALAAFALIPIYCILTSSSATSGSFPSSISSYFSAWDFIESHFAALDTTVRSSGEDVLPNIYCGIIALITVPLFIINKEIKLREKITYVILLVFFFVCFNCNVTNFVWHAFHFPNDLPYRFSYMYSFILLIISFKSIIHIKAVSIKDIGLVSMAWLGIIAIAQELATEKMSDKTIWVSLAFIIIWCGILFIIKSRRAKKTLTGFLVCLIAFGEIVIADPDAFDFNQNYTAYTSNYDTYTDAVEHIQNSDTDFYRTELCYLNTRMDDCLYGYSGISMFSSMAYETYSELQYNLGMRGNRINSYTYYLQTPVYNMMYSLKYFIYNNKGVRPSSQLYTRYYDADGGSIVYENDYFMPIAFCVNPSILDWDTEEGDPFRIQGDFFSLSSGY